MINEIELSGINGANPLAFLAALGTLRILDIALPEQNVKMRWEKKSFWQPAIQVSSHVTQKEIVEALSKYLCRKENREFFKETISALGKNLSVSKEKFHDYAAKARKMASFSARSSADFASAFGSEACITDKNEIQKTHFCFTTGQGHQYFLESIEKLIGKIEADKANNTALGRALFCQWSYEDEGLSLRWDPFEDRRYAYRWENPTGSYVKTEHGANLLAVKALPLFPAVPVGSQLKTTGFYNNVRKYFFVWPIWTRPVPLSVVISLLTLQELHEEKPNREILYAMGIQEVFRAERLQIERYKNFSPGRPV